MIHLTARQLHVLFNAASPIALINAMDRHNATREPDSHVKFTVRNCGAGVIVLRDELPDHLEAILKFDDVFMGVAA